MDKTTQSKNKGYSATVIVIILRPTDLYLSVSIIRCLASLKQKDLSVLTSRIPAVFTLLVFHHIIVIILRPTDLYLSVSIIRCLASLKQKDLSVLTSRIPAVFTL